jgi:predicted CoA-binding protein
VKRARVSRNAVDAFFAAPAFAVIGVSADRKKFGNVVYREMRQKGYTVVPVHPTLKSVEGDVCYASVRQLPDAVKAVVTVVPPAVTRAVIPECVQKGISSLWMQQGSESEEAIAEAREGGMTVVHGQCVLMFLQPVKSVHAFHRWLKRLVGSYPV